MPTLLEKAKEVAINKKSRFNKKITVDDLELALAVCKNEVTGSQAAVVWGLQVTQIDSKVKQIIFMSIKHGLMDAEINFNKF